MVRGARNDLLIMLSIIVATKNRTAFLQRLLKYLAYVRCPYPIYIGDSSESLDLEKNIETIKSLKGTLQIFHQLYPTLEVGPCYAKLGELVSTPYCVCVADGAFLVIKSLGKCVDFLEANKDYAMAHGISILFQLCEEGPHGIFRDEVGLNLLTILEQNSAAERLAAHCSHYLVPLYSVMRTSIWQTIWSHSSLIKNPSIAGEVLASCYSVLFGKIKQVNCLYLVRHIHSRRTHLEMIDHWFIKPDWSEIYQIFRRCLASELAKQDMIPLERGYEIVDTTFATYVRNQYRTDFLKTNPTLYSKLKATMKRIPGIQSSVLPLRKIIKTYLNKKDISLMALRRPSSPYHDDFMPIYQIVTQSNGPSRSL